MVTAGISLGGARTGWASNAAGLLFSQEDGHERTEDWRAPSTASTPTEARKSWGRILLQVWRERGTAQPLILHFSPQNYRQ